ncbi:teichoic acid D-Ala incorporation-associated protein DltX [Vagococcus xieshaowenii]|uniref:Teichoic acid D-Ala incorporation-associated protein DltX n=1 Tax=Vagococcus xieshaowenii TaxID=2562451 RepID=A0AAJ5EFJ9_9ENTE|nr:teichoic acid D-Ala incorporation-associated protein DltX [Vagococcus xieshaowenii]QCA29527.1 teichoic acid D-Ala incorporation-associated protein DltX [Vagococcus xieshaowenii]TFZ42643.1 teichoic acid D-Ala incorporation-associated protein DltX [Vagococcus xieshaowenii]
MKQLTKLLSNEWTIFSMKAVFYTGILVAMIYLYHFCHVGQGSFIYNQF